MTKDRNTDHVCNYKKGKSNQVKERQNSRKEERTRLMYYYRNKPNKGYQHCQFVQRKVRTGKSSKIFN